MCHACALIEDASGLTLHGTNSVPPGADVGVDLGIQMPSEFVTFGGNPKWGVSGVGNAGNVVTWSIVGAGATNQTPFPFFDGASVDPNTYFGFDYVAQLKAAFAAWSNFGNIEFVQVTDAGGNFGQAGATTADIRIGAGQIDGPSNVLARAYSPGTSATAGDMIFDSGETTFWNAQSFFRVALHEIGHSLGLDHEPTATAIMNAFYNPNLDVLQADDVAGIQFIYGNQDNGPSTLTMRSGQTNLTLLDTTSAPNLTVNGNSDGNVITGTTAAETINGLGGNDTLNGGGGNDVLDGGAAVDSLSGGEGNDTLWYSTEDALFDGGAGFDTARASGNAGLAIRMDAWNVEQLFAGSGGDNIFTFGTAAYSVDGGGGADSISGNAFGDTLGGNVGNDVLDGRQGNDILGGGAGSDRLLGAEGADLLFGEADPDSYIYRGLIDAGDQIVGFETFAARGANGDKLEIQRAGFLDPSQWAAGALDPNRFVAGQATLATGQFLFDTNTGNLFWDGDGTGAGFAQLLLTVQNVNNLSAADFVLV